MSEPAAQSSAQERSHDTPGSTTRPLRESELLATIARSSRPWPSGVLSGPGDDMAMLELSGGLVLAAVDQVIEGRHVAPGTPLELVARKAVARNLSDVAAMAARPVSTLAACALPRAWTHAEAEALFHALRRCAAAFGCPLVGGDVAILPRGEEFVLSVTILAEPWPETRGLPVLERVVHRHRAREGDGVFVTGRLGGSLGMDGLGRHLRFEPRVEEARALLGRIPSTRLSMVDLSDGLGRDAAQLVGDELCVEIDATALPCADGCDWRRALGDGEDYELCFATSEPPPATLSARGGGATPVTRVGVVRRRRSAEEPACVVRAPAGEGLLDGARFGWEHRGDG